MSDETPVSPYPALLMATLWHGVVEQPVFVVGESTLFSRVQPAGQEAVRLPGRLRWLPPGETALVPKTALRLTEATRG